MLKEEYNIEEESEEEIIDENGYIRLPAKPVSRETFLVNEKLRRQREARNFKYTGSADAPKLTRSGKIIGRPEIGADPDNPFLEGAGENGRSSNTPAVGDVERDEVGIRRVEEVIEEDEELEDMLPLPGGAEGFVRGILDTLTGRRIAFDPPPFANEGSNEALTGLLNLLKGTVERGEGNSALLTGARGVGKTRVSEDVQMAESNDRPSLERSNFFPARQTPLLSLSDYQD